MNTRFLMLAAILFFLFPSMIQAQALSEDFFIDRWQVLIEGTPNGDASMILNISRDEDVYAGRFEDQNGTPLMDVEQVQVADSTMTIYWTADGYDISLNLKRTDDNHLNGSLLNMFDSSATRLLDDDTDNE